MKKSSYSKAKVMTLIPVIVLAFTVPSFFAFAADTVPKMDIIRHGNGETNMLIRPANAETV